MWGAQSSTVVIRGMNTDEIRAMGQYQVILREGIAGLMLGTMLGSIATVWARLRLFGCTCRRSRAAFSWDCHGR